MLGITVDPQSLKPALQKLANRAKPLYESYKKLATLYLSTFGKDAYAKSTIANDLTLFEPFINTFNPSSPYFNEEELGLNTDKQLENTLTDLEGRYIEYRMQLSNKGADVNKIPGMYAGESGIATFKSNYWPWILGAGAIAIGFMIFRKKR